MLLFPPVCGTPEVLDALRGLSAPTHAAMVRPPPNLDGRRVAMAEGLPIYGSPYEHHIETAHFTIEWSDDNIDPDAAETAGEALEGAWLALVEQQGWTPPVSSDEYLIWVLLDPDLGMTGFTTEYTTRDYPQGYPIIYLDPAWATQDAFWGALAAHEFMHTLQYALRDWDGTDASEAWYWEASANWASELSDPDRDGYQYASEWYADQADLSYDSMVGYHQYGMFVFNAWLEEQRGQGTMKAVWDLSASDTSPWDELLESSTGSGTDELWGGFTGAYGNRQLAESDQYTGATTEGGLEDGSAGELPKLGTHYWNARQDGMLTADGDVVLGDADEHGTRIFVERGDVVSVTAVTASDYVLTLDPDARPDTGSSDDTGAVAEGDDTGLGEEKPGGCACGHSPGPSAWIGVLALGALRRRTTAGSSRSRG